MASTKKKSPATKDPKGGLTAAGRKKFKETEGANLKPGVKGPADKTAAAKKLAAKGSKLLEQYAKTKET